MTRFPAWPSLLARDLATDTDYVLEGSNLDRRYTPLSTFKIANLVIALETGVAASLDDWRAWIPQERPAEPHWPQDWRQGQTLEQAFRRSVVWYFRDLARRIGSDTYRARLSQWGYGNAAAPRIGRSGSTIRCASRSASRWASWRSSSRDVSMFVPRLSSPGPGQPVGDEGNGRHSRQNRSGSGRSVECRRRVFRMVCRILAAAER